MFILSRTVFARSAVSPTGGGNGPIMRTVVTGTLFSWPNRSSVNLNKLKHVDDKFKLSVGSEVELSQNFGARKGFYAIPTLAIKWSFD